MYLAIAMSLLVASAGPDIRLYAGTDATPLGLADHCLASLQADPTLTAPGAPFEDVGIMVMTADGVGARACDTVEDWRAAGFRAYPGMRVYGSYDAGTIMTAQHWDDQATLAQALLNDCGDSNGIGIDAESYHPPEEPEVTLTRDFLAGQGVTVREMRGRMASFLSQVALVRTRVYPLDPKDEAHRAIVDRSDASAWDESTFRSSEVLISTPDEYGGFLMASRRYMSALRSKWRFLPINNGMRDDVLRGWGYQIGLRLDSDFGPDPVWVFDFWRGDTKGVNASKMCSQEWVNGTIFDSRNDIGNAWRPAIKRVPLRREPVAPAGNLEKVFSTGGADNGDNVTLEGGWATPPSGTTYQLDHYYPQGGAWTVATTWRVEELGTQAYRAVWGSARAGTGSGDFYDWWIEANPLGAGLYDVLLAVRAVSGQPTERTIIAAAQPEGRAFRHSAVIDGETLTLYTVDDQGTRTETESACLCYGGRLRLGQPVAGDDGLVSFSDDVVVWDRALTPAEAQRNVVGETWPWGRN